MRLLILPGMDGSGRLLEEFVEALAPTVVADVVAYPPREALGYDELFELAGEHVPEDEPFAVLGESFSGPVAIRIVATRPRNLVALILCASFASSPQPWFRNLWPLLRMPLPKPPVAVLMPAMMGRWTTRGWMRREHEALRELPSNVARHRLSEVLRVDATRELARVEVPTLYLQASHDRLVPPRCWREVARILPKALRVELEGPHFILQHQPERAAGVVRRFLAGVADGAGM